MGFLGKYFVHIHYKHYSLPLVSWSFQWNDKEAYMNTLRKLANLFITNFEMFKDYEVGDYTSLAQEICFAGPHLDWALENIMKLSSSRLLLFWRSQDQVFIFNELRRRLWNSRVVDNCCFEALMIRQAMLFYVQIHSFPCIFLMYFTLMFVCILYLEIVIT